MLLFSWLWALAAVIAVSGAIAGFATALRRFVLDPIVALAAAHLLFLALVHGVGMVPGGFSGTPLSILTLLGWAFGIMFGIGRLNKGHILHRLSERRRRLTRLFGLLTPWEYLSLVFPALYMVTRFFTAGLPQQHSDPLYYHLAAPKVWLVAKQIQLSEVHPSFFQAGLWDAIYGIPLAWLGSDSVGDLVCSQIAAQWLHFIWGQTFSGLIVAAFLMRKGLRWPWAVFWAWLCVSQPAFEWLGGLAKCDLVSLGFLLASFYVAEGSLDWGRRGEVSRALFAGLFVGGAIAVKLTAVVFLPVLLILHAPRYWLPFATAVIAAALPIGIRSWIWTQNFFYPFLTDQMGPHWISVSWVGNNASIAGGPHIDGQMLTWLWTRALDRYLPKVFLLVGIVATVVRPNLLWKQKNVALGVLIGLGLCCLVFRPAADGRFAAFPMVLAGILAGLLLFHNPGPLKAKRSNLLGLFCAVALSLLVAIPIEQIYKIPKQYLFSPANQYLRDYHETYPVISWVRERVFREEKILFVGEKQLYYLDRPYQTVVEMARWEDILAGAPNASELFRTLRLFGYSYVHFSPHTGGHPEVIRRYWPQILAAADQAVFRSPTSLVFDTRLAFNPEKN